jgi:hypothetical protein
MSNPIVVDVQKRIAPNLNICPQIYAYITPDALSHRGWIKIDYTGTR